MSWGSYWNTTVVVQQPIYISTPQPQPSVAIAATNAPSSPITTTAASGPLPTGSAITFVSDDGQAVIVSRSQAWQILASDDAKLATEVFAAFLDDEPEANDLLLGYTLALALDGQMALAGLALEEVLARDAYVLLTVPMTMTLRERLGELKLRILLDARGAETDLDSIMVLATVRTILGEDRAARAALVFAERLMGGETPGTKALRQLLDALIEAPRVSWDTSGN